tara:strand:- start:12969 stop:13268 length:300 start_codon:yes stop_codon:yes gene_type:complete
VKVKTSFPIDSQNRKAVREQLLLDSTGSGVEDALFSAANNAKTPDQKVFVSRSYGQRGRLAVWIVDDRVTSRSGRGKSSTGTLRDRTKALKEALARVRL